jgi:hypothetical protein
MRLKHGMTSEFICALLFNEYFFSSLLWPGLFIAAFPRKMHTPNGNWIKFFDGDVGR